MKFAMPMAIMKSAKVVLTYVNCRIDDMNGGGIRIMIVVNRTATLAVATKGTKSASSKNGLNYSGAWVRGREDRH